MLINKKIQLYLDKYAIWNKHYLFIEMILIMVNLFNKNHMSIMDHKV